jgi:hypothetical protein
MKSSLWFEASMLALILVISLIGIAVDSSAHRDARLQMGDGAPVHVERSPDAAEKS